VNRVVGETGYLQGLNRRYWNFKWNSAPMRESERQAIAEHVVKLAKN
jgi:hypothetical protein